MTLAGTAGQAGSADGTGSAALFNDPRGVAVDSADNVYVADTGNDTIRKLSIPSVPAQSGLTGTSAVPVNAALTGLQPNTTYYYEVVATNSVGTTDGSILSFTTPAAPAATLATTQAASNVTSTAATLSGSVNPEGAATSVSFIYGTDPDIDDGYDHHHRSADRQRDQRRGGQRGPDRAAPEHDLLFQGRGDQLGRHHRRHDP